MSPTPNLPQMRRRQTTASETSERRSRIPIAAVGGTTVAVAVLVAVFAHAASKSHQNGQTPAARSNGLAAVAAPQAAPNYASQPARVQVAPKKALRQKAQGKQKQPAPVASAAALTSPSPAASPPSQTLTTQPGANGQQAQQLAQLQALAKHKHLKQAAAATVQAQAALTASQAPQAKAPPWAGSQAARQLNTAIAPSAPKPAPQSANNPAPASTAANTNNQGGAAEPAVVEARFVEQMEPVYPEIAKQQGAQGTAIVLATIGPQGNLLSATIEQSTGNKLLDQAALSAARASRFRPPEVNGKAVTQTYRIVYRFSL